MLAWPLALKISAGRDAGPAWGGSLSLRLLCDIRDIFSWAEDPVALSGDTIISSGRSTQRHVWLRYLPAAGDPGARPELELGQLPAPAPPKDRASAIST